MGNNNEVLVQVSPFIIIIMNIIILYGLHKVNKTIQSWRLDSLCLIPIALILLYTWIGVFQPEVLYARTGLRIVLVGSLSLAIHVIFSYIMKLNGGNK